MKANFACRKHGFTLIETLIAIGVLAVLLTGFMMVFAPAAAGIRTALNVQEVDRLTSTLEQELITKRTGETEVTGFEKAFKRIQKSNLPDSALLVYQYRGKLSSTRADGTPTPEPDIKDKLPGKDYVVQTMVRTKNDANFKEDLTAIEGGVYLAKCTQLIFSTSATAPGLILGTLGTIKDPKTGTAASTSDAYPEAVIAFAADFYNLKGKNAAYFDAAAGFAADFNKAIAGTKKPVFTRNLAVRR